MSENKSRPSLYVDHLHLKGFKSIEDLEVKINPGLNILIGKNGAGKSNFLEFLETVLASLRIMKDHLPFKSAVLKLNDGNDNNFEIDIAKPSKRPIHDDNELWDYYESYHQRLIINNQLVFDNSNEETINHPFVFNKKTIKIGRSLHNAFPKMGYYFRISPSYIRFDLPKKLSGIETPTVIQIPLADDDSFWNFEPLLPNFLWEVFLDTEDSILTHFDEVNVTLSAWDNIDAPLLLDKLILPEYIIDNLIRFTPIKGLKFNENITLFKDDKFINIENIKLEFLINERWTPWSQLSDGTKRLFFIITEITSYEKGLVLIEEPELGIHPHQFDLLMQFIKEQSLQKQIILSTHSPKALDHLEEDELDKILIAVYDREKGTQLHHLNPEQIHKAKTYMNEVGYLSDYWLLSDLEE